MCGVIRPDFQCLEEQGQNFNVWKDRARIPVFRRIRPKFQCVEELGQNSNVWKDKVTNTMF